MGVFHGITPPLTPGDGHRVNIGDAYHTDARWRAGCHGAAGICREIDAGWNLAEGEFDRAAWAQE